MAPGFLLRLVLLLLLIAPAGARAEEARPYPRISEEAFQARLPFFQHNPEVPLEARVVRVWETEATLRQKIVFRGAQGFLVPGYLELPKAAPRPVPLVLLLHGWSGSKEAWYQDEGMISGGNMRRALIEAGFATLALDAATHGERASEIDYQHVNPFDDPEAPERRNYFSYAEIAVQTVKDYRRALDYLDQRGDVDTARIGLVGYSMGGMLALPLMAVEPRVRAVVACVPPLYGTAYEPAMPVDYSWGVGDTPLLLLMGRQDEMYDEATVQSTFDTYLRRPSARLIWYEQGHKLTPVYVPDALAWLEQHLIGAAAP